MKVTSYILTMAMQRLYISHDSQHIPSAAIPNSKDTIRIKVAAN